MGLIRGLLPAAVAAAALLSLPVGNAQGPSIASCSISGSAFGNVASDDVFVEVVSLLEVSVCGGGGDRTATEVATETATAIASAVANATADCTASNLGSFIINGQTLGSAVARSTAEALLDALVIAESCQNCTAGFAVFSNLFEEIIVNGVSVAEVELAGQSQFGTTVSQSADFFIETVVNSTVTAAAGILTTAIVDDDFCLATVSTSAAAGSQTSFCDADTQVNISSSAVDGIAEVSEAAVAVACGAPGTTPFQNQTEVATAIANGTVRIVRDLFLNCELPTNGVNCFVGLSFGQPTANATAAAFAQGVASASSLCPDRLCSVSVETVAEAIEPIFTRLTAEFLAQGCVQVGGFTDLSFTSDLLVSDLIPAVSSVIASAQVAGDQCTIFLNVTAEAEDSTVNELGTVQDFDYEIINDNGTFSDPVPPAAPVVTSVTNEAPPTPPAVTTPAPAQSVAIPVITPPVLPPPVTPLPSPPAVTPQPPAPVVTTPTPTPTPTVGGCADPADCVSANRQCAGTGFAASKACCDAGFLCVRRNERFAQCRLNGDPGITTGWDGTILPCGTV